MAECCQYANRLTEKHVEVDAQQEPELGMGAADIMQCPRDRPIEVVEKRPDKGNGHAQDQPLSLGHLALLDGKPYSRPPCSDNGQRQDDGWDRQTEAYGLANLLEFHLLKFV